MDIEYHVELIMRTLATTDDVNKKRKILDDLVYMWLLEAETALIKALKERGLTMSAESNFMRA